MKDVVVILNVEAIAPARLICAGLADYETFLFDAVLGDPATAAGLRNVQLFTRLGGPSYFCMDEKAHAAALALETRLDAAQRLTGTGLSVLGWQHLNLYYLFITLDWYAGLWERVGAPLLHRRVHVFINDNPAEYYFDSFLPALTLVCYLQRRGAPVLAYDYGARGAPVYSVPNLSGEASEGGADCVLTHLPTCMYDYEHFAEEFCAAGKTLINVESKYWNTAMPAQTQIGLADVATAVVAARWEPRLAAFTVALREQMQPVLAALIGLPNYCARQVEHLVQLYRAQLVTYLELERHFSAVAPGHLVLSEHDTGFHGPLISFARERALPVSLLPHSKVSANIDFTHADLRVLTHPIQGQPIFDLHRRRVVHWPVKYPERFSGTSAIGGGLRCVSLLLNAMALSGVPYAPSDVYLDGVKRIVTWFKERHVRLKIRCRPGYGIIGVLRAYAGVEPEMLPTNPDETLDQHVSDCDLCVMYDMPTTGALVMLRNSIVLLNPVVTRPIAGFLANVHPDVVVTESLDAVLERMDGFLADPLSLSTYRDSQFQAYLTLFRGARPLRSYFESSDAEARNLATNSCAIAS